MRVMELHAKVSVVQRAKGRTATSAAAYRSASRIECERTGQVHDYRRKQGIEETALLVSAEAPNWAKDRVTLWNRAELREKHPRAQPAREIELSFPFEFSKAQRREAGLQIGQLIVDRYKVAADLAWHRPSRTGDNKNFHLHVLFTARPFKNGDWSKTKDRTLDDRLGKGPQEIEYLRQAVAGIINGIATRDKLPVHIEHRSFARRGLDREPTQHMGPIATQMERRGVRSRIGSRNRAIMARNKRREKLYAKRAELDKAIALERAKSALIGVTGKTSASLNRFSVPMRPKGTTSIPAPAPSSLSARGKVKAPAAPSRPPPVFPVMSRLAPAPIDRPAPHPMRRMTTRPEPPPPNEPRRPMHNKAKSGPMSKGELYEYYRRAGMLSVFWGLFPDG